MSNVIDLSTEDNLQYTFYPVSSGYFSFKIRAPNDAHIALTTGPQESDPIIEIFIGGWGNAKSVIRRNRTKPEMVEADTPNILNAGEFRGFWIRWDCGIISAGREGEVIPFLTWQDPEPFPISFVGVCTGWGATGSWKIEDGQVFETEDKLTYKFHPVLTGQLEFEYRGPHNCHVALTPAPRETDPMYELIIGGWENSQSAIRHRRQTPDKVTVKTQGIVTQDRFRKFLIQWRQGRIIVRDGENGHVIMEWSDPSPFPVTHFGVRTGWGARGQWRIFTPGVSSTPSAPLTQAPFPSGGGGGGFGGSCVWVPASNGQVPPGAVAGGQDKETLYVARARHEGALLPGKLVPGHGLAYVAWGGAEHPKNEYEVLVGGNSHWVASSGANVPPGALPAGESEDGEPLFVGRVQHEGTLTIGKVQPSHNTCYIPFGGQELGFPDYEVLVV